MRILFFVFLYSEARGRIIGLEMGSLWYQLVLFLVLELDLVHVLGCAVLDLLSSPVSLFSLAPPSAPDSQGTQIQHST